MLGQINQVFDDDLPTGEALFLLPWETSPAPLPTAEAPEHHRARLEGWLEAMEEYRGLLAGEVELLELRWRDWVGVHDLWLARGAGGQEETSTRSSPPASARSTRRWAT